MTSPAVEFREMMLAANIEATPWELYVSREPPSPDTTITCYDTGGISPLSNLAFDWVTVQVRIRGLANGYEDTFTKAQEIKDAMLAKVDTAVDSGNVYTIFLVVGDIISLGYDEDNRPVLVLNFRLGRRAASLGNRRAM